MVVGEIYTTVADTLFPRALTRRHYCTLCLPIHPRARTIAGSCPPPTLEPRPSGIARLPATMDHHVFVRVGERKKIRPPAQGCESPEYRFEDVCCCLSFVVVGGSRFRMARFHRTIVARDEQPAILLAANVFA